MTRLSILNEQLTKEKQFNIIPTEHIISCFYSWENTSIVVGVLKDSKVLIIEKIINVSYKTIAQIEEILSIFGCRVVVNELASWKNRNFYQHKIIVEDIDFQNTFLSLRGTEQVLSKVNVTESHEAIAVQNLVWLVADELTNSVKIFETQIMNIVQIQIEKIGWCCYEIMNNKYLKIICVPPRKEVQNLEHRIKAMLK